MNQEIQEIPLLTHFFEFSQDQVSKFQSLKLLYTFWNQRINVISRKDIDNLEEHHILHSLAIAKWIQFKKNTRVLDIGTGGGFPGIPLAIIFPEVQFTLVDSISKKIKVVNEIASELNLKNVEAKAIRAEDLPSTLNFDFVLSRAVTRLNEFWPWVESKFNKTSRHPISNGLIALKGGDLKEEIHHFGRKVDLYPLRDYIDRPFFDSKFLVYVSANENIR